MTLFQLALMVESMCIR